MTNKWVSWDCYRTRADGRVGFDLEIPPVPFLTHGRIRNPIGFFCAATGTATVAHFAVGLRVLWLGIAGGVSANYAFGRYELKVFPSLAWTSRAHWWADIPKRPRDRA